VKGKAKRRPEPHGKGEGEYMHYAWFCTSALLGIGATLIARLIF
jgi:hypothetical protein